MTADQIIAGLSLQAHPEGGWYHQSWVADATGNTRPAGTCIYFLLKAGERSHWHRIDATEIWHFYSGAPLILSVAEAKTGPAKHHRLGPDLAAGDAPQLIVPPHHWQAARSTGTFSLVGCSVSPGFRFQNFELAAPEFDIP